MTDSDAAPDAAPDAARFPPTALIVSDTAAWLAAAETAAGAHGLSLRRCRDAREAVALLALPDQPATHLLVEARCTAGWAGELVALTVGEAASGVALVMLGAGGAVPPRAAVVPAPDAGLLGEALGSPPALARAGMDDAALRASLAEGGLDARLQPIVRVSDRAPAGFEILARLVDAESGTIGPGGFIPQAERAGMARAVTEAVAARAFAGVPAAVVREHGLFLSLNVPLDVLLLPEFLPALERRRAAAGLRASDLLLELTESQPVRDLGALAAAVERWRFAGYRLAIDDAGPEIMNHRALFRLPFDAVKFDMTLVRASGACERTLRYLRRTIGIGQRWGQTVIAEGVTDEATWERMRELGVDQVQGFMIGRPLPPRAVPFWLRDWRRDRPGRRGSTPIPRS